MSELPSYPSRVREFGFLISAMLISAVVGLIVAPQIVRVFLFFSGDEGFSEGMRLAALFGFDLGLFMSGLAVALVVIRAGFLKCCVGPVLVVLSPVFAEMLVPLLFGRLSPVFSTPLGIAIRVGLAIAALGLLIVLKKPAPVSDKK